MEAYDFAEIFDLKLVIECDNQNLYFVPYYKGENATLSPEGLKSLLSLYNIGSIKSQRGKVFEFVGEFDRESDEFFQMGYSTNTVVSFDGKILKSYRMVGSREPDLILSLKGIAPKVLGWGKYDRKYIQIVTERIVGEDVGKLFYKSYRKYLRSGVIENPEVEKITKIVAKMHEKLEKFGVEKISDEDIIFWRKYAHELATNTGIKIDTESLFEGMEGKEKIMTHQDLHFSQMIMKDGRIYVVDFEGEPLRNRPYEKLQPIRDISTLARAVDYITHGDWNEWEEEIVGRLYEDYRRFASYSFDVFDYADWMIEKALYEINYEMRNRPDMVSIPRKGLKNALKFREGLK